MAEIYKREFGAESVVIAYGENLSTSQKPELLKSFNLSKGDYYLIVGSLIPDNNASLIVEGFKQSRTQRKLVIVGDVPYKDAYADAIKQTKDSRIIFTGYVRDLELLRELCSNSYIYLHGHEFGGTNPTLLKALACGCCVIALDTIFNHLGFNSPPLAANKYNANSFRYPARLRRGASFVKCLRTKNMAYFFKKIR